MVSRTRSIGVSGPTTKVWLGALLPVLAGCSALGGGGGPTPQMVAELAATDVRIQREVEARLAAEPSVGPGRVRVVVQGGEVQLHGSVSGMGAVRCAESNAGLTPGVSLVIDFLVLQPGPSTTRCIAPRVFGAPA